MVEKKQGCKDEGKLGPQYKGPLMICPTCGGNGQIVTDVRMEIDGKPTTKVERVTCPKCKGSGEIR